MVFTIPWQNVVILPMLGTISRLAGFMVVGVALLYVLMYGRTKEPSLFLIIMVLYVVWQLMSYFWSINPGATFSRTITNVQLLAMAWLIWELCKSENDRTGLFKAFVIGAFVSIGDMIMTYMQGTSPQFRIAAANFDPNYLATTLAISIPLSYYLINKEQKTIMYFLSLLYMPLALFGIVLTASRGGLVVALVALTVIPLTYFSITRLNRVIISAFVGICIIFVMLWLPGNYEKIENNIERIAETPQFLKEGDLSYRQVIWSAGWKVFAENPIVGVGARGFRYGVVEHLYGVKAPHNTYLSVLVDTGVIGIILFLSAFLVAFLPNINLPPPYRMIYLVLLLSLMVGLIPINWEADKNTWFILSLLTLQYTFVIRSNRIKTIRI